MIAAYACGWIEGHDPSAAPSVAIFRIVVLPACLIPIATMLMVVVAPIHRDAAAEQAGTSKSDEKQFLHGSHSKAGVAMLFPGD